MNPIQVNIIHMIQKILYSVGIMLANWTFWPNRKLQFLPTLKENNFKKRKKLPIRLEIFKINTFLKNVLRLCTTDV